MLSPTTGPVIVRVEEVKNLCGHGLLSWSLCDMGAGPCWSGLEGLENMHLINCEPPCPFPDARWYLSCVCLGLTAPLFY